ncbi:MAG: class I SAM-dependent methyltransferase [Bacteroidetes bacterium]|nr:MAG: class I SAM-dependent methyltransferase [Bacteroidota bacterium]TAG87611.1 MAG: class I SAM-dependent methyltransferase [Bacteroidota bacterium]
MNVIEAYEIWSEQYDTNENKTRDLEAISLNETLTNLSFQNCLEIGCGTGKNTSLLLNKASMVTAIDLSNEMLEIAKNKIKSDNVEFLQADITNEWSFVGNKKYDLITFSLVLEHIENIDNIFQKIDTIILNKGYVYIGELHPFKQYNGSKARFETNEGVQIVTCFTHNISDFTRAAKKYNFEILCINEYFDNNDTKQIPRILTILLKKH